MAGGIDWFRWHHGSVSDGKFALVAHKAGASVAEVIAVWACLLEAASSAEDRGNPGIPDFEAMDFSLGMQDGKARRIYERMRERSLLEGDSGRVSSWEKRQPKRERTEDSSAARTRSYRDRQAASSDATQSHVTPSDATQRQETPRGEESREEQIQKTPPASRVPPADAGRPRAAKRCPESFAPDQILTQWARHEAPQADFDRELAKFRDHTFKTAHSDWPAAFRNWLRRASDDAAKRPQSFQDRKAAEAAKWMNPPSKAGFDYIDMEAGNAAPLAIR